QALEIDSNDSQTLAGKGDVLSLKKRYSEAFDFYRKAEGSPGSSFQAPDWAIRGDNLYEAGQVAEAIAYYEKSIASDPKYLWAWVGKGLALGSQQKLDEAMRCFDEAVR